MYEGFQGVFQTFVPIWNKKYFKSQKMCFPPKTELTSRCPCAFFSGLTVFPHWFCRFMSPLVVLLWSGVKNLWRSWQSNQLVSDRRRRTDPEALLVYFVRVKAVQGYTAPKPLLPLRNIIRKSPQAAKENIAEHCWYVCAWAIVVGLGWKNNA